MMCRATRRSRRPGGRRGGYTLPEVLIASALLSLLLIGTLRWVGGLVEVSATHADLTRPRLTARFLTEQFRTDVQAASVCQPNGIGGVVHAVEDDHLALYVDDDGDGDRDVVWWRYTTAGTVERAVDLGSGSCSFAATPPAAGWAVLASAVVADGDQPAFSGIGGQLDGYTGVCTGTSAESCLFHAVRLQLTATSPVTGVPSPVDVTATLDLSGSLL